MSTRRAVSALQRIIIRSTKIKIQTDVLNTFWGMIATKDANDLKNKAWIINNTLETVKFSVYNHSDQVEWKSAHNVDAQPSEPVEVHGGVWESLGVMRRDDDLTVYKDNQGTAHNVRKNHLYLWTGSAMIPVNTPSTIECFRNQCNDPRRQNYRSSSSCCAII